MKVLPVLNPEWAQTTLNSQPFDSYDYLNFAKIMAKVLTFDRVLTLIARNFFGKTSGPRIQEIKNLHLKEV